MFDELDVFIFKSILNSYNNSVQITNWDIAKDYSKKINEENIDKIFEKIKFRLKKYCEKELFFKYKNGDGKFTYNMINENISLIKRRCKDGMKEGVWIRI